MIYDKYCAPKFKNNKNLLVSWYLMASYAYYIQDNPILSDALYDDMAKQLLKNWKSIEHKHKHLITKSDLRAGTLMIQEKDYPYTMVASLDQLRQNTKVVKRRKK